jgi:hypothetical protein
VERLVGRVRGTPHTDWGRWRRVHALQRLERAHHPAVQRLVGHVLDDPDPRIASAAIRTLGDIGDDWAIDILIENLRRGNGSRSRIAAELEELEPAPGARLLPLLRDWTPAVRFWGATLLRPYPDLGTPTLIDLTWDQDPNVRAAAVETLGTRAGQDVGSALLARVDDSEWFVRVHAARAAGHVLGAEAAPTLTRLLADGRWWVRTAAKDALRGMAADAVRHSCDAGTRTSRAKRRAEVPRTRVRRLPRARQPAQPVAQRTGDGGERFARLPRRAWKASRPRIAGGFPPARLGRGDRLPAYLLLTNLAYMAPWWSRSSERRAARARQQISTPARRGSRSR